MNKLIVLVALARLALAAPSSPSEHGGHGGGGGASAVASEPHSTTPMEVLAESPSFREMILPPLKITAVGVNFINPNTQQQREYAPLGVVDARSATGYRAAGIVGLVPSPPVSKSSVSTYSSTIVHPYQSATVYGAPPTAVYGAPPSTAYGAPQASRAATTAAIVPAAEVYASVVNPIQANDFYAFQSPAAKSNIYPYFGATYLAAAPTQYRVAAAWPCYGGDFYGGAASLRCA